MSRRRGIILKSAREIELIRAAGGVVHRVLSQMRELAEPGITTQELNAAAEEIIAATGGVALFKGVRNPQARGSFPAALCTSVNEELVHGIPSPRALREGDIVSIDCGVRLNHYCGDSAVTLSIGKVSPEVQRLLDVTRKALDVAIAEMHPGRRWSEVARKIQRFVESAGMSVVRDFVGHGIGRDMHEEPKVPNYHDAKQRSLDFQLEPAMVLAVEPMVNLGRPEVEYGDAKRWVVVTKDRRWAAHFEHTVAVTANGTDILTDGR